MESTLEKIFQEVELASELRAQVESRRQSFISPLKGTLVEPVTKRRRVSISRFGQLVNSDAIPLDSTLSQTSSGPSTPTHVTSIAAKASFYTSRVQNESIASFASVDSIQNGESEDHDHVTQIHKIAGRQSISRALSGIFPRRLSKMRSTDVLSTSGETSDVMVIGVSVQEATVLADPETTAECAVVSTPALRNQTSNGSMATSHRHRSWLSKAKGFTQRLRRKSKPDAVLVAASS